MYDYQLDYSTYNKKGIFGGKYSVFIQCNCNYIIEPMHLLFENIRYTQHEHILISVPTEYTKLLPPPMPVTSFLKRVFHLTLQRIQGWM